ncbi:hypothetical protein Tco_0366747 [Tanacetum coccineum]
MMTTRKRVGPLPTHRPAVRHSVDYSSSDHFYSDDSSSSSSSETSSDSPADALSNSASSCSSSDHSLLASPSGMRSSNLLCSLVPSVHRLSAISERPSHDSSFVSHFSQKERSLLWHMSDGIKIDLEIQADIDECFAYADALRDREIDARVVVKAVDREESETGTRGPVEVKVERVTHPVMPEDTPDPAQEGAVEREQGRRIVGAESAVTILTERVAELERDNRRLKGTTSVESQRVDRIQRGMAPVNEQSDRRMAEALRVHDAVRNIRPLMGDEVEQEEVGGNGNGGNGDRGNGSGGNGDGGNGNGGNGNRGIDAKATCLLIGLHYTYSRRL